jgi:calcium/calmodulin-dependent protein kinase I
MAPEQLLNNQYSKPVDIWSCGVIMYMLFSMGKHPTAKPHETREHYIENLNNCQWQQPESMPDTANDFMRRLTCLNPLERYSAGQALMHPWITRKFNDEVPMNYQERILMFEKQINFA